MEKDILMKARGLSREFSLGRDSKIHALTNVDLDIYRGETLALVGESGCGKSTLGRCLIGLLKPSRGEVWLDGEKISGLSDRQLYPYRPRMQLIFQDPYASLDPRMTVEQIIAEPLRTHKRCSGKAELRQRVEELMEAVGLPLEYISRYPHQFSGGQRQRVGIARAIALKPELIVCDEPVSALDVSVQNQILNLLRQLQKRFGLTYLFISHDLSVVRFISDRACVMFLGSVCEMGDTELLYKQPLHPYTRFLLDSIPKLDPRQRNEERPLMSGEIPSPVDPPKGCPFHSRCPHAKELCSLQRPELRELQGRKVACHFAGEL